MRGAIELLLLLLLLHHLEILPSFLPALQQHPFGIGMPCPKHSEEWGPSPEANRTWHSLCTTCMNRSPWEDSNSKIRIFSLENDLKALKVVHSRVLDTVLLFPHPKGLPYRSALKVLAAKFLKRRIQVLMDALSYIRFL